MRRRWWLLGCVVPLVACGPPAAFPCLVDEDCIIGALVGVCQPAGFCSFPDSECASGQRYGDHAGGGLARDCVDVGTTTSGDDTTHGETSAVVTSLDSTVSATLSTTDATTTGVTTETTTGDACPPGWADCGHPIRRSLFISGLEEVVTGFAVPWRFNLVEVIGDPAAGHDPLRFTDVDGNVLPVDYEVVDTAGNSVAWTRVPKVQGLTQIYVYYGGVPLTVAPPPVEVWTPEYVEVWHGDGQPGRVMGVVLEESAIAYAEGEFGAAPVFDGEDSRLRTEAVQLFPPTVTLSAWTFARSFGEITFARVFDNRDAPGGGQGFSVLISDVNVNVNTISMVHGCKGGDAEWVAPDDTIALDVWQHVAVSFDFAQGDVRPLMFIDGAQRELEALYGDPCTPLRPLERFAIGNVGDASSRTYDGSIDEVRIYDGLPDPARIALDHASGSPTFVAVGEPEMLPTD